MLATFADARALIGHLHAQKRGEYRPPSPSEVLRAIIEAGRDIGDPEMSQSVLVLAFMPTIHRTYREIRAWFQELSTEDIAQQTFLLFLELATSTAAGLLGGQLSFALARSLHRNTLRWARKEQLMLFEEDRFREEQQRAAEPSEDAYFEPASLLEDFLDYCVHREIISAFERALLLKIKVDGFVAKEAADTHTVLSPKAVHMRMQRIMKKLQEAAGSNVIEMKLPKRVESVERKQRKNLSKTASTFSLSMSTGNLAIGKSRRQLSLDIPPRQVTAKAQQFSTRKQDSLALFPSLTSANERKCVVRGAASRRLAAIPISDSVLTLRNSKKSGESLPSILRKELAGNEESPAKETCLPLARYQGHAPSLTAASLLLAHLRISGIRSGARWLAFTSKLLARGHATEHKYQNNARVFQFTHKGMYASIGKENIRNRRKHSFEFMKTRLAMLDFVLSHLEHDYFEGEAEKVQYFEQHFAIRPQDMPGRTYRGANKVPDTIRYFVDKCPIFLDSAVAEKPLITFTFIDPGFANLDAFRTHLDSYAIFCLASRASGFIEREGVLEQVPDLTLSEKSLIIAVKNIARRLGDDISEAKPILDSRLPDGSRVAAVIPPCSIHGVTLTIRKFNSRHFAVEDLIRLGTLNSELAVRLRGYVHNRQNILISGGTGSGKTTLLNALGKLIPDEDRILLIEDTSEIQLQKPNLVRFEARQGQPDLPAITIRDLLRASLRHRPDRIILGEIRGGEAFDLLQLLNTGHSGTLSTVHASSAAQALARFTSCVLQSGIELPYRAIKSNIADSLNVLIQLERRPGKRFVSEVLEIGGYDAEIDKYDLSRVAHASQSASCEQFR